MNHSFFVLIQSFAEQSFFLDQLIIFCARYLPFLIIFILIIFFIFHHHRLKKEEIIFSFISVVIAWISAGIIKYITHLPRPFDILSFEPLFRYGSFDSFPSGHTALFAALATAVFFYHRRLGITLGILALVIGVARIAAGIHWPFDIAGGFILGVGGVLIFHFLYKKHRPVCWSGHPSSLRRGKGVV